MRSGDEVAWCVPAMKWRGAFRRSNRNGTTHPLMRAWLSWPGSLLLRLLSLLRLLALLTLLMKIGDVLI